MVAIFCHRIFVLKSFDKKAKQKAGFNPAFPFCVF
jgi:hypothetical protein